MQICFFSHLISYKSHTFDEVVFWLDVFGISDVAMIWLYNNLYLDWKNMQCLLVKVVNLAWWRSLGLALSICRWKSSFFSFFFCLNHWWSYKFNSQEKNIHFLSLLNKAQYTSCIFVCIAFISSICSLGK